ncbi:MAG: LEVG family PEP-CTERM protein, partial [Pseudomonadales bacterium]
MKSISDLFRHSTTVASLVAASAVTAGFLAPSASAGNLVPQDVEGEIKTKNLGCIVAEADCLDPETFDHPYTVTSLPFDDLDPSFDLSRLFVDLGGTANNYPLGISFSERDAGTNPEVVEEFWLRPVALQNGAPVEGGELEVGRFRFEFAEAIEVMKLDLSFFDVEDDFVSGILEVNGEEFEDGLLEGGPDDAIQTVM